jgi:hypothetical protein
MVSVWVTGTNAALMAATRGTVLFGFGHGFFHVGLARFAVEKILDLLGFEILVYVPRLHRRP